MKITQCMIPGGKQKAAKKKKRGSKERDRVTNARPLARPTGALDFLIEPLRNFSKKIVISRA